MNIELVNETIFKSKIKNDSTNYFSFNEIQTYAEVFDMPFDQFCVKVLKLSEGQTYKLKTQKNYRVKCIEFDEIRNHFFKELRTYYILEIIKIKTETDYSYRFTIQELEKLSLMLGINVRDLCTQILGISKGMLNQAKNGIYKNLSSKKYKEQKEKYLSAINEEILKIVLYDKVRVNGSSRFSYEEIIRYSNIFNINAIDFLYYILGIKEYGKDSRTINQNDIFHSIKYKSFKNREMEKYGLKILDDIVINRMANRGDSWFEKDEINELSKKYSINIRDFMVYVLGKSEQLYYDLRADRVARCFSRNYRDKKDSYLISKKENFMDEINPNIRTYYSLNDLNSIACTLGISTYDLIVNVMGKHRGNYYNLLHNCKGRKRVSVGEYKSGQLPTDYCEKNIDELLNIIRIAVRSAIGYMTSNGFNCKNIYYDLIQEAYMYIADYGNPINEEGVYKIVGIDYQDWHGAILYKKAYFRIISIIKNICNLESTGMSYDVNIKTKGTVDYDEYDEDCNQLINELSDDETEKNILKFFSQNTYSEKTIKEACIIFKVDIIFLQNMFETIRTRIANQDDNILVKKHI